MGKTGDNVLKKLGLIPSLIWGYVGVALFMLGCAAETSWLSSGLVERGLTAEQAGTVFSVYGISVALASWLSGVCVQAFGPRKVMWTGLIIFLVDAVPFTALAFPTGNYGLLLVTYLVRGLAYPLFAYSFLTWVTYRAVSETLTRATAWFWICFNLGMTIVGPWAATNLIPLVGEEGVLWMGTGCALVGAVLALTANRDKFEVSGGGAPIARVLISGLLIMFRVPKIGIGTFVKMVNCLAQYTFAFLLPIYLPQQGFTLAQWAAAWSGTFIINLFASLFFGFVGDRLGWRRTVAYFGGTSVALSAVLVYLLPAMYPGNFGLLFLAMAIYGFGVGAYSPLSAIVPMLAPENKGAAVSALNFGTGMSNFVGPVMVTLLVGPFGAKGVLFTLAGLYLLSSILTVFLRTPADPGEKRRNNKGVCVNASADYDSARCD